MPNKGSSRKHISAPELCTGCALCANVCPKNAISMVWSPDGFSIPSVNEADCINCGLCIKSCIALELEPGPSASPEEMRAYGAWHRDNNIHEKSSSGGVFSALSTEIIREGGVVFGVVWKNSSTAEFRKATTAEELAAMRGSKYTQALPGLIYREVKRELSTGHRVLFAGTPCQVHALKQYLRKDYPALLTLDTLCHGVPSHLILEKHIAEAESRTGQQIDHVDFRDKRADWNSYAVTNHYSNGQVETTPKEESAYMQLFLADQALNKSCYTCKYAKIPRQGDITIGDYWGVSPIEHPQWPIQKGISAVLANTQKGRDALENTSLLNLHKENFLSMYRWQKHPYISTSTRRDHKRKQCLTMLRGEASITDCAERYGHYFCRGIICLNRKGVIFRFLKVVKNFAKAIRHKIRH